MLLHLLGRFPDEAGAAALRAECSRSSVIHTSTNRILGLDKLSSIRKKISGGVLQPSPYCILKYDETQLTLSLCGYTEFKYSSSD